MIATDYERVRRATLALCSPLEIEDYGVQPMDDASPPKWHLAHTTWFFETFVLNAYLEGYTPFHPEFEYLFNSYYNGVGTPYPRPARGHLSRPTVDEVRAYREHVDEHMSHLLEHVDDEALVARVTLGLNHEQQHQELLLTDLKYNFGNNPLYPTYAAGVDVAAAGKDPLQYVDFDGGVVAIGAHADSAFAFDNERPAHDVLLGPYALADRLVRNDEFLAFVADDGYRRPELWLSEGWAWICEAGLSAPLYWFERDGAWFEYRLDGAHPLAAELPAVHISAHEAFAYANWCGARLPTEFEWESAARAAPVAGNFVDAGRYHPTAAPPRAAEGAVRQLFGDVWEWTASSYGPYPGYRPLPGTLGEYNGKFMSSQLVLRGGSCATPSEHVRPTYRNFFYPPDRWQFSGIRLARDV